MKQAPGSQGRSLCGTAEGKQREDTAREVVDGSWEADHMRASVRDVKEKEVMCAGEGQHDVVSQPKARAQSATHKDRPFLLTV